MTRLAGGGSASGVESGIVDGTGSVAMFFVPFGVAVSTSGTVYVTDNWNNVIRTISPTGTKITISESILIVFFVIFYLCYVYVMFCYIC